MNFDIASQDFRNACNMVIADAPSKAAVAMAAKAVAASDMAQVANWARQMFDTSDTWPCRPGAGARARKFRAIFARFAA